MRKSGKSKPVSAHSKPLAETLKSWRADRGLSAAAAAERLEISVRTLEGIEQGREFRYEKILRLALNSA
jgi:transcriptional regulator with XRE-family HTH domain